MSLRKDGIIVVLSTPSGAGKTTLVKTIAQEINFKIPSYDEMIFNMVELIRAEHYLYSHYKNL